MTSSRTLTLMFLTTLTAGGSTIATAMADPPMTYSVALDSHTSSAAVTLNQTGPGSGTNGPATAQVGLSMHCSKTGFTVATTVGEDDCIYAFLRQGGPNSSGSGMLLDVQNTGLGFLSATEMSSTYLNPATGTIPMGVDIQEGVINRGTQMYGAVYSANAGAGLDGVLVQASGTASWASAFQAQNNAGHTYFVVDGNGNVTQDGNEQVGGALYVRGILQASASKVSDLTSPRILQASDCGTVVRNSGSNGLQLAVADNLPVGCHIGLVQGGSGRIDIKSDKRLAIGILDAATYAPATAGRYAEADLFIQSPGAAILRGDLAHVAPAAALAQMRPTWTGQPPLELAAWHRRDTAHQSGDHEYKAAIARLP